MNAAADVEASRRWKFMCYEGFVESVDELVGPSAIDCIGRRIADS